DWSSDVCSSDLDDICIKHYFRTHALYTRYRRFNGFYVQHAKPRRILVFFPTGTIAGGVYFFFNLLDYRFYNDIVDPYEFDLLEDFLLCTIPYSQHCNYGSHTEDNTQGRQQRPQPIRYYRF